MDDVISRQAAIDEIKQVTIHSEDESLAVEALENLPSVERKGKWIEQTDYVGDTYYDCSACGESWTTIDGTPWDNGMNFCPKCGADMRGEEDE